MRATFFLGLLLLIITGCQKEKITISGSASDVFYVENAGASMRVFVHGNTASKTFILVIHGGPGVSSYFYDTKYISQNLGDKYAMVYWDQRNSGASQGTSNGKYLHLSQMVEDLQKVIQVLKYRYGQDMSLFLLAHSFGGMIATDFLTTGDNQNTVKGFIDVDASHNYPLNDTLTRQKLISYGNFQIAKGRNTDNWQPILSYCEKYAGNFSLEESQQFETYAGDAEKLVDSVKQINFTSIVLEYSITDNYPLTSILSNLLYSEDSEFNKELAVTQFSSSLDRITLPVLEVWGKYDFVCPMSLGMDFYKGIKSSEKRFVISPISGHDLIFQDEKLLCDEVNDFVLKNR